MKLYFQNSWGERRIIATPVNDKEAIKEIHKFCEDRNFKIHYTRTWINGEGLKVYDVGSHTEFFLTDNEICGTTKLPCCYCHPVCGHRR